MQWEYAIISRNIFPIIRQFIKYCGNWLLLSLRLRAPTIATDKQNMKHGYHINIVRISMWRNMPAEGDNQKPETFQPKTKIEVFNKKIAWQLWHRWVAIEYWALPNPCLFGTYHKIEHDYCMGKSWLVRRRQFATINERRICYNLSNCTLGATIIAAYRYDRWSHVVQLWCLPTMIRFNRRFRDN